MCGVCGFYNTHERKTVTLGAQQLETGFWRGSFLLVMPHIPLIFFFAAQEDLPVVCKWCIFLKIITDPLFWNSTRVKKKLDLFTIVSSCFEGDCLKLNVEALQTCEVWRQFQNLKTPYKPLFVGWVFFINDLGNTNDYQWNFGVVVCWRWTFPWFLPQCCTNTSQWWPLFGFHREWGSGGYLHSYLDNWIEFSPHGERDALPWLIYLSGRCQPPFIDYRL